jgi:hypothetical protein
VLRLQADVAREQTVGCPPGLRSHQDLSAPARLLLSNGLTVATESHPHAQTATVGVWIDITNGAAHFLEHMLHAFKFNIDEPYTIGEIEALYPRYVHLTSLLPVTHSQTAREFAQSSFQIHRCSWRLVGR